MPYIITTTTPEASTTSRAVATLAEAENATCQIVLDAHEASGQYFDYQWEDDGRYGPLPDGTMIEVERVAPNAMRDAAEAAGVVSPAGTMEAVVDAYNAAWA